jgi:hypothetical protein
VCTSPLVQTLIGGGLAILGGLLVALYQSSHTRRLAIQLRAEEREEEGLLRLGAIVGEGKSQMSPHLWNFEHDPNSVSTDQAAAEAERMRSQLWEVWQQELAWKIRDKAVGEAVADLLTQLGGAAGGGSATQDELQRAVDASNALAKAIKTVLDQD